MRFHVHDSAKTEALRIALWYDEQSRGRGDEFTAMLQHYFDEIRANPHRFGPLEYPTDLPPNVRRVVMKRFPYIIVYVIDDDAVRVVAVYHAHREPGYWTDRLDD